MVPRLLLLSSLLPLLVFSSFAPIPLSNSPSLANAVEIRQAISTSSFQCIRQNNVQTVFIQAFQATGGVDPNLVSNVNNAHSAGLGIEVFITPWIGSTTCSAQLDAVITALQRGGISLRSIWLLVTTPILWYSDIQQNIGFIGSCLQRAVSYGYGIGLFTNSYDWRQITGNWNGWQSMAPQANLWYWQNSGVGSSGASPPNFNDFVPFSGFTDPVVKQYSLDMNLCGALTNYNVYVTSKKKTQEEELKTAIVIGGHF